MKVKLIISVLLLVIVSCTQSKDDSTLDPGYGYFPLKTGQWIEYQLDSVIIHGIVSDTVHWKIKEVIGQAIPGNGYYVYRYYRKNDTLAWSDQPLVWNAIVSTSEAQKFENNVRFLKLVFPVQEGKKWDGNLYNSYDTQEYSMHDVGSAQNINSKYYTNTLKVLQLDVTTLISQDYADEVFALGIGMVSSRKIHIENLQSVQHKFGYIVDYKIIDSGK